MISALVGDFLHCRSRRNSANCWVAKPSNKESLAKVSSSGTAGARLDTMLRPLTVYLLASADRRGVAFVLYAESVGSAPRPALFAMHAENDVGGRTSC